MEKHSVVIENRGRITVTDVVSLDTFDEEEVCADLSEGRILIKGKRLHIQKLDLEEGAAVVMGDISSVEYMQKKKERSRVCKLFK
jgi:sporulation protein YabP